MKYYLYISDAKVDMLYPQIPHDSKSRVSTELGFDVKFAKASRKVEKESEDNRYTRLEAVVQFIEDSGALGSLDNPGEYVRATLPMRFAPWGRKGKVQDRYGGSVSRASAQFVCFVGKSASHYILLWGSWKHVLGNTEGAGEFALSTSLGTFALWDYFDRLDFDVDWHKESSSEEEANFAKLRDYARQWRGIRASAFGIPDESMAAGTMIVHGELRGPQQNLEFIAKKFRFMDPTGKGEMWFFLGTPLYVALAE
jgi:hypothetical protein